jgi:transcriptional regulator with XRE-family HTH domain
MYPPMTVIEVARKAMGASQAQLALWGDTQQSSISEYESRRKSPTLEVVERLLAVLDFELAIKPVVLFEAGEDAEIGEYVVPERLWSVPMPDCLGKIQVLGALLNQRRPRVWDLSVEAERIDYYEWVIRRGIPQLMLESVDGVLLMQVWDRLDIPTVIREA